jgi:WD40 repeat protein
MRRFRPRSSKPGRLWPWLIVWFVLVIVYLIWVGWPRSSAVGATLDKAVTRSTHNLSVSYTGYHWHNKPVYVLTNNGSDLERVNIYNLAEDLLPVLYVGFSAPDNMQTKAALMEPPYNVPKAARMWFVSSVGAPTMFSITWDENGKTLFTTVTVKDGQVATPMTTEQIRH